MKGRHADAFPKPAGCRIRPTRCMRLVADVAQYPQFIPWNQRLARPVGHARGTINEVMLADLVVGFKMFRERFLSRVTLWPEARRIRHGNMWMAPSST